MSFVILLDSVQCHLQFNNTSDAARNATGQIQRSCGVLVYFGSMRGPTRQWLSTHYNSELTLNTTKSELFNKSQGAF